MRFNKILFQDTINSKCFEYQMKEKKFLGLRFIAGKISISASTLSRIKNGAEPDLTTFCKVCEFFNVKPEYFIHK